MRLFDRFVTETSFGRACITGGVVGDIVVVNTTNIASHWHSKQRQTGWSEDDYPFSIPPWEHAFLESSEIEEDGGATLERGVFSSYFSNENKGRLYARLEDRHRDALVRQEHKRLLDEAHSAIIFYYVFRKSGRTVFVGCYYDWVLLEKCGRVLGTLSLPAANTPGALRDYDNILAMGDSIGESLNFGMEASRHMALLAFTYANCKNIVRQPVVAPDTHELKKRRRWKTAENKEYTLQISKTQYANDSERKGPQGIMPEHLCRGHFAHYTEEKKLFGKYTGRFWHPPHMRGKPGNGTIKKDYAT